MSEILSADIQRQREAVDELNQRAYEERYNNTELTLQLGLRALEKAKAIRYPLGQAWALRNIGIAYAISGRPDAAQAYMQEAIALFERLEELRGIGLSYANLATIYQQLAKLDKAIEFYSRAIRYLQLIPDLAPFYAQSLANLGSLFAELEQYDLALDYHQRALEIHKQNNNLRGMFFSLLTLGALYIELKDYAKAERYLTESLDTATELGEEDLVARALLAQSQLLHAQGLSEEAMAKLKQAEQISTAIQNASILASVYLNMADVQLALGLVEKAEENIAQYESLSKQVKEGMNEYFLPQILAKIAEAKGDYEAAYKHYKNYTAHYTAMHRTATRNMLASVDRIIREEILGMKKEAQADLAVASRIQEALLHGRAELQQVFPESVYWSAPRSLVSGDFLWTGKGKDGSQIFIVADASGAGVSAAMLSTIAHTLLYEIITMRGVTDPGKILSQLHKSLLDLLYPPAKATSAELEAIQSEGLQIGICTVYAAAGEVHYAGAKIPLWVYNPLLGWEQLTPDKRLVGQKIESEKSPRLYTSTIIPVEKRWTLLFMTDGWERQVRASDGKRYGGSAVRDFLAKHPPQDLSDWLLTIQQEFDQWREGAALTDDVLLAAVRI